LHAHSEAIFHRLPVWHGECLIESAGRYRKGRGKFRIPRMARQEVGCDSSTGSGDVRNFPDN
jgi:hypothetical protein